MQELLNKVSPEDRGHLQNIPEDMALTLLKMKSAMQDRQDEIPAQAKKQAKEIRKAVIEGAGTPEQLKLPLSPLPTELTRTSPFFPMSKQEMSTREYIRDMIIADHAWGSIKYSGPKLSVYEEDMLIILLALLNEANNRIKTEVDGQTTYTYRGSLLQLLKMKGINKPGKNHYEDALSAFKLMTSARFDLTTNRQEGKKKIPKKTTFKNLIMGGEYDHDTGEFTVTINPYFYEAYAAGEVTMIDAQMRSQINSPIAKALFRFMQSHRDDCWYGPLMTISAALNLDMTLPKAKLRERLKKSVGELVKLNVLTKESRIEGDHVTIVRQSKPLSSAKKKAIT
ncbi:RepB family plasmid replication initiator protein [Geobacter sp. OR-1]|uniref:RepB family plasmid replication initiator protein n=1 Tax=Geobacter sp. OR-1 TaxID=1266765 RepID=UPI000693EB11|nr:RepB family plasmid replication initiator protein [Geobacter sp. OR-1]